MTDSPPITELFIVLVDWAISAGAEHMSTLPGVWTGETDEWVVQCNGSATECREDIPPLSFQLTHKTAFVGVAVVGPFDGALMGPSEGELLEHFRAATERNRRGARD